MKITLPESIADITLAQYQRFDKLNIQLAEEEISIRDYNKRKIDLFSGIPYHKVDKVSQKDLESVMLQIDTALNREEEFTNTFKIGEIEFGFIPNLDEITSGEYFDLNKYGVEVDTLHNLMAILFRPIENKDKVGNYNIQNYNGTKEYANLMKKTPMHVVNGALVFFCNLSTELQSYIQRSTEQALRKERKQATTLENGDGIVPSMN